MKQKEIEDIVQRVKNLKQSKIVIGIDGRCGSGKTTLASELGSVFHANVFHLDDYFLRKEQRTAERYAEPGGNVDRERFFEEIGCKLHTDEDIVYAPFDCETMQIQEEICVKQTKVTVIEGSYSMHPYLRDLYDLRIFLDIDYDLQIKRIKKRNPDSVKMFIDKWIPLEEKYFSYFDIEKQCDIILKAEG